MIKKRSYTICFRAATIELCNTWRDTIELLSNKIDPTGINIRDYIRKDCPAENLPLEYFLGKEMIASYVNEYKEFLATITEE